MFQLPVKKQIETARPGRSSRSNKLQFPTDARHVEERPSDWPICPAFCAYQNTVDPRKLPAIRQGVSEGNLQGWEIGEGYENSDPRGYIHAFGFEAD
jgi:hypothetical protein